ncbi:MAG TPA: hypothetical protein VFP17_07325 [Solirubrobacterales bacterium]|nr:hypothetical protein [Solirubrobacterales bacterium]
MNTLKKLALAAVAVVALMATVGAGSASATFTSLCRAPTTPGGLPICEGAHLSPAGTTIHAHLEAGTRLVIPTPNGVVECAGSTIDGNTEQQTAKPLGVFINVLNFGGCEDAGEPVDVEAVKPGTMDIEIIDLPVWTHNGTLTLTNSEIRILWTFTGDECFYDPGDVGVLTGGAMATIDWNGPLTYTKGNLGCAPGNGTWSGSYTVTQPEPLWVSM